MMSRREAVCAGAGLVLFGCGRGGGFPVERPKQSPTEAIRQVVAYMVETGKVGSATESVDEALEELGKTDPGKAAALRKDMDRLFSADEDKPAQVKEAAKAVLKKL